MTVLLFNNILWRYHEEFLNIEDFKKFIILIPEIFYCGLYQL